MPAGKSHGSTAREYRRNNILLWNTKLPWCNAENYVPQPTYLLIAVARPETRRPTTLVHRSAYPGSELYRPDPADAAQRSEGTVRSELGLKYGADSLTVTKGSKFADDC